MATLHVTYKAHRTANSGAHQALTTSGTPAVTTNAIRNNGVAELYLVGSTTGVLVSVGTAPNATNDTDKRFYVPPGEPVCIDLPRGLKVSAVDVS